MKLFFSLTFLVSLVQARIPNRSRRVETECPKVEIVYDAVDRCVMLDGNTTYRWTLQQLKSHSKEKACLMSIYDTVYEVKGFADIHRGGADSIKRNCGKDATFGYESLVCIPGVPDHTPGVLNMLDGNFCASVVGVIKDSPADPCAGTGASPDPLPTPDFEGCPVYDVLTCDHLDAMPNGGRWNMTTVQSSKDTHCYTALYNYVFALGLPPQQNNPFTPPGSGQLTFADKHGGGSDAVLNHCQEDITEVFETLVNMPGKPDHTKGALNAILPYLVGVIQDSDVDPCVEGQGPPTPCDAFQASGLKNYTLDDVVNSDTSRCYVVVLGKVYDVQEFKQHHHGGADEIEEHCRQDITGDFFEKPFHTLVQLGAIQQFQKGVIKESMADPCSVNYVPNPDGTEYGGSEDSDEEEPENRLEDEDEEEPESGLEDENEDPGVRRSTNVGCLRSTSSSSGSSSDRRALSGSSSGRKADNVFC